MDTTIVLMISSAVAAILHTLVPDHEIPLAMIGRTQNWTVRKMAGITLIAGLIHISVSMGIGVLAVLASVALAEYVARSAQLFSGSLLIAFGILYDVLAWKRKRGGHSHSHSNGSIHHSHSHSSEVNAGKKPIIGWGSWVTAIVGIAPCFTLIPVLIAAIPYGVTATLWVMLSYAIATIGMMVILTSIALKAIEHVTKLERIERHLEIIAGLVILIVGVWLILEIQLDLAS